MPVELVAAVVAGRGGREVLRVLLGDHLLEHRSEGDAEALEELEHGYSLSFADSAGVRRSRRLRPFGRDDFVGTTRSSGGTG